MFQPDWFGLVDSAPQDGHVVRAWDLAATENQTAAYTVGVRMRKTLSGIIYVEHVIRFRGSAGKVEDMIRQTAENDGVEVPISIPQDPGQAGKAQKRHLALKLHGFGVGFSPETGHKEVRARGYAAQAEAGNVKLVRGLWNGDYLAEVGMFPMGKYKDQIDASSRAYAALNQATQLHEDPPFVAGTLFTG